MFSKEQLKIILQMLGNAQFKTPEAEIALKVLEICRICEQDLNKPDLKSVK